MNTTTDHVSHTTTILVLRTLLLAVIVTSIIVSNIFSIIILGRLRELQTVGKTLLINLSIAGLLNGSIVCFPGLLASATDKWSLGDVYCKISSITHGTTCSVSIWCLATVSLDRYVAVTHPVRYRNLVKFHHCLIIVFVFWFIGILTFSAPMFFEDNYYIYQRNIVICGMYWKSPIFCVVVGLYTPILSGVILFWTSYKVTKTLKSMGRIKARRCGYVKTRRNAKAVRTLVMSGISYFIAWGPYTIVVYLIAFKAIPSILEPIEFTVAWLANSNSFVNVLIYSGNFNSFRKRLQIYISRCFFMKSSEQNTVEPTSIIEDSIHPTLITQL